MSDVAQMLAKKVSEGGPQPRSYVVLRAAISLIAGLVCLVIVVLWCRSYTWRDRMVIPLADTWFCRFDSDEGTFQYESYGAGMGEERFGIAAVSHADLAAAWKRFTDTPQPGPNKRWRWEKTETGRYFIHVPHWFVAVLAILVAITPWLSWRYSLRTLLIAMVVASVALGLLVWINAPPRQSNAEHDTDFAEFLERAEQQQGEARADNSQTKQDGSPRTRSIDFAALVSSLNNTIGKPLDTRKMDVLESATYEYNGPIEKVLGIVDPIARKSGFSPVTGDQIDAAERTAKDAMGGGVLKIGDRKMYTTPGGDEALSITKMAVGKSGPAMLTITYMHLR